MNDSKKLDDWKIPLYKIYTDDEDVDVITRIIKRGSKWAIGPEIEEFEDALKKVGMWNYRSELMRNLSGGQRQRAFIARALVKKANILLLDEAFSGVDIPSQVGVLDVLKELRDEGKTILIATHDLNTLSDRFDELLCLNRHICAHGDPETVFTKDVLIELYGSHEHMFTDHKIGQHGLS